MARSLEELNDINIARLDTIKRRVRYLEQEVALRSRSPSARRWIQIELDSLQWAVAFIEAASGNGSQSDGR